MMGRKRSGRGRLETEAILRALRESRLAIDFGVDAAVFCAPRTGSFGAEPTGELSKRLGGFD
jgi:hypothetical protein